MIAKLYNYGGEVKKINKELGTPIYVVNFQFLDNYDLQSPHVVILFGENDNKGTAMPVESAFQVNYITLEKENDESFVVQCYFVDKVIWQNNYLIEFALRKDVLTTYKTQINSLVGMLIRAEESQYYTKNIVDEKLPLNVNHTRVEIYSAKLFELPYVSPCMLINTIQWLVDQPEPGFTLSPPIETVSGRRNTWRANPPHGIYAGYGYGSTPYIINCLTYDDWLKAIKTLFDAILISKTESDPHFNGAWFLPAEFFSPNAMQVVDRISIGNSYIQFVDSETDIYFPWARGAEDASEAAFKVYNTPVLEGRFGDFRDYSPYTKIYAYIPFFGELELRPEEIYGRQVTVTYTMNFTDGSCLCKVYAAPSDVNTIRMTTLLASKKVDVAIPFNIRLYNANEVQNKIAANGWSTLAGIFMGASMLPSVVAGSAGVAGAVGTFAGVLGAGVAGYHARQSMNPKIGNPPQANDAQTEQCSPLNGFFRIEYYYQDCPLSSVSIERYKHFYGCPSATSAGISDIGSDKFFQFGEIHAEIPYATSKEKEEIEKLLKEGCYK